jgi:two-component system chemotaxis response regulator CheY
MTLSKDGLTLVVDDFMMAREYLRRSLAGVGFRNVIEAENGAKAWDLLVKQTHANAPVGLIISDLNMPNMDGFEFLRKVRASREFKDLPFVVVTVNGEAGILEQVMALGASDYLVKPFTMPQIEGKISELLKKFAA